LNSILLLEDDPILHKTLVKLLTKSGFEVDSAKTGEEALDLSYENLNKYSLYLFDINVPLINGLDLLKELRDSGDRTPAIILSALIDIDSITKGFIAGADDYIKKPFDADELIIRVKAKMRRLDQLITFKDFTIDIEKNLVYRGSDIISMGDTQKKIFITLVKKKDEYVSKDELLSIIENNSDGALRVNIAKLKKKLDIEIDNLRGVGYKIIWERVLTKEFLCIFCCYRDSSSDAICIKL